VILCDESIRAIDLIPEYLIARHDEKEEKHHEYQYEENLEEKAVLDLGVFIDEHKKKVKC